MFFNKVKESADYILSRIDTDIDVAVILGSGLGKITDIMEDKRSIPYKEIPNFPQSSVEGHAGNLIFGKIGNTKVMALQGRFHYYEGFTMRETAYPVFLMKLLNINKMIVTNACGGMNPNFKPGDLMIIDDFINSVSDNPLRGANDERFGVRFPDMSEPYCKNMREKAKEIANNLGIETKSGVYVLFQGPYYETVSEIKMYRNAGGDAIGMSTVPETIVANYAGIKTLGISCITNMATGLRVGNHSHEEVVAIAEATSEKLCKWMEEFIKNID